MAEEIHLRCIYCKHEFNVEWQGKELTRTTGVCGKKRCIRQHKGLPPEEEEEKKDKEK